MEWLIVESQALCQSSDTPKQYNIRARIVRKNCIRISSAKKIVSGYRRPVYHDIVGCRQAGDGPAQQRWSARLDRRLGPGRDSDDADGNGAQVGDGDLARASTSPQPTGLVGEWRRRWCWGLRRGYSAAVAQSAPDSETKRPDFIVFLAIAYGWLQHLVLLINGSHIGIVFNNTHWFSRRCVDWRRPTSASAYRNHSFIMLSGQHEHAVYADPVRFQAST